MPYVLAALLLLLPSLALAGSDADHFPVYPGAPPVWEVQRSARWPSRIELPVVER